MTKFQTRLAGFMADCKLCQFCSAQTKPLATCHRDPGDWSCYIQRVDELACGQARKWFQRKPKPRPER